MKRQIVGLVVLFSLFAGLITTIIVNSKYIFRTEPYYSETQVEQMCKDAYQQSIKDNSDTALYNKMSELTIKNLELTNKNETLIAENETLNSEITEKEKTILDNKATIENLNLRISELEDNKSVNETLIAELRGQLDDLNEQNNLLVNEISEYETLIEKNNKTITQLQNSISYYEEYIQGLETEDEVFAIFVVENEIFNIQKLNKNGLAYLETEPTFAENATFNGWVVNDEIVDLTSYYLSCNTTFIADITYTYNVNFIVDDEIYSTQTFVENNFATAPEVPTKDGYVFVGWSLDGVNIIDLSTYPITSNISFIALYHQSTYQFSSTSDTASFYDSELNKQIEDIIANNKTVTFKIKSYYTVSSLGEPSEKTITYSFDNIIFTGECSGTKTVSAGGSGNSQTCIFKIAIIIYNIRFSITSTIC